MRGKKVDSEFLSEFISTCIKMGMETPVEIAAHASALVREIDEEIKAIEKRKVIRSKLLDVISTFDKPIKTSNFEEVRALSFFKIQSPATCKHICDALKKSPCTIDNLIGFHSTEDIMFCIKQLLEHKVIHRSGNLFLRGDMFDEYLKFVLRDK